MQLTICAGAIMKRYVFLYESRYACVIQGAFGLLQVTQAQYSYSYSIYRNKFKYFHKQLECAGLRIELAHQLRRSCQ